VDVINSVKNERKDIIQEESQVLNHTIMEKSFHVLYSSIVAYFPTLLLGAFWADNRNHSKLLVFFS
jgi:hypothetical protein